MAAIAHLSRYRTDVDAPNAPAVYARISFDAEEKGLGVKRQLEDCLELLDRKGWPESVDRYVDNDISATRKKGRTARRPEWERLLADIEAKRVDAVVAWELDRICRDPLEQEQFFLACELAGVQYVATYSDEVDIESGEGMMMARIKGAVNAEEARKIAKRVKRKKVEIAGAGQPAGGPRPFGYDADQVTIREDEAALVREAAQRILAGETPVAVCRAWNAAGITTARGREWRPSTLIDILTSPRVAGLRQHQGEIVGEAVWPAILTRSAWERIALAVRRPDRQGLRGTSHLLSGGLLRCSKCGTAMSCATVSGKRRYRCPTGPALPGCGGVTILGEPLEEIVIEAALQVLETPKLAKKAAAPDDSADAEVAARLQSDEAKLLELSDDYADNRITRAEWLRQRDRVEQRIAGARRALATRAEVDVLDGLGDTGARQLWPSIGVDRRRAILAAVIARIVVTPAQRGVPHFDPGRVTVEWRA